MSKKDNFTFGLKNFRNYDAEGAEFIMAPITVLTGENSAGKSSLVKALMLMNKCMEHAKSKYVSVNKVGADDFKLNFIDAQGKLGRYDISLNSNAKKGDSMVFTYKMYSDIINEDITIEYTFTPRMQDLLNNGWLSRIVIYNHNKEVIYLQDAATGVFEFNYNLIKDSFKKYMYFQSQVTAEWDYHLNDSREDVLNAKERAKKIQMNLTDGDESWLFKLFHQDNHNVFNWNDGTMFDAIRHFVNNDTIFYFPIVEVVGGMEKNEAIQYLKSKIIEKRDAWIENEIKKKPSERAVMSGYDKLLYDFQYLEDDFRSSECTTFSDYIYSLEQSWLDFPHGLDYRYLDLYDVSDIMKLSLSRMGCSDKCAISWKPSVSIDAGVITVHKVESEEDWSLVRKKELQSLGRYDDDDAPQTPQIYKVMARITTLYNNISPLSRIESLCEDHVYHPLYSKFIDYAKVFLTTHLMPIEALSYSYVSSSRAKVQRLYTLENPYDEFSNILLSYFDKARIATIEYTPSSFTNKWLQYFGIAHHISVENSDQGLGVIIKLHKSDSDEGGHLLADEGYGITQLVSIFLQIEVAIMSAGKMFVPKNRNLWSMRTCGDGQMKFCSQTIAIEEPEIHLHPKYQSLLADMFLDAYQTYNIRFIIETHSEYLIRESQVLVSKMGFQSNKESDENSPFRTYYIPKDGKPYSLGYRKDGRFAEKFGDGFYNESTILTNKML